jgi:signal transduction histidine kinase
MDEHKETASDDAGRIHASHHPLFVTSMSLLSLFIMMLTAYFVTNIMDRLRAEESRSREERQRLEHVLQATGTGLLMLDSELQPVWYNEAMQKWLRSDPNDSPHGEGRIADWVGGMESPAAATLRDGAIRSVERDRADELGEKRSYQVTIAPLTDEEGTVYRVVELVQDITDRKLLRAQLIHAEKLAAVGEMAAVVAHEMRNSFTSVQMILQLLMETEEQESVDRESIRVALDSLRNSESVVSQLLQFARPDASCPEACQTSALVEESIRLIKHQLDRRGIQLAVDSIPGDLRLWADKGQLKTALVNLLLNASQAVADNGQVTVRCQREVLTASLRDIRPWDKRDGVKSADVADEKGRESKQGKYRTLVLPAGESVVSIGIEDDGAGVPEEEMDLIFDPFYTTKVKGTGLGLPLVKLLVNENGGVVTVANLESGCRFTLILPLYVSKDDGE